MKLQDVKGIGPKSLEILNQNNIYTVNDLLFSFPKSYSIYELGGQMFSGDYVTIKAKLETRPLFIQYRKRVNAVIFYVMYEGIKVKCIIFSNDYLKYKMTKNMDLTLYGRYKKENAEFVVKKIFFEDFKSMVDVDYKLGIKNNIISTGIKNIFLNNIVLNETLPSQIIDKYKLLDMARYIYLSHFPSSGEDVNQINRRRKYEEFYWYALKLETLRDIRRVTRPKKQLSTAISSSIIDSLDYKLTFDQLKAINVINNDLNSDYPMNRLIQGDVGCGKTIVAILAASMLTPKYQVAVMVPTEVLANQAFEDYKKVLAPYGIIVELLTSSVKKSDKNDILYRLAHGRINVIVGTHSLIEDNVLFSSLGLVIIDEQHKFGVEQRTKLINKYPLTDSLFLTATPIPRTLGLTAFGDLDITSIKTMPSGRKRVKTMVLSYNDMKKLYKSIDKHLLLNEQVYVVVPHVEQSDEYNAISVTEAHKMFVDYFGSQIVGVIHGRLSKEKKDQAMNDFKVGNTKILISTTVIEVGVNVKNATVMVIMDANLFGLAQIHQLRGRVGRSSLESFCILVTNDLENPRLDILSKTTDGFEISEADFALRGPGDYFGNQQSGAFMLDYSDFTNDKKIWDCAKDDAKEYYDKYKSGMLQSYKFKTIYDSIKNQNNKIN